MKKLIAFLFTAVAILTQATILSATSLPLAEGLPAKVTGTIVNVTGKSVEIKPDGSDINIILNLGERPVIIDSASGQPVALNDREHDNVVAYYGPATTKSIPAQSNAIAIICNVEAGSTPPQYAQVEALEKENGELKATILNGSIIVTINKDTQLSPYLTRNIVTMDMIDVGSKLLIWYPAVNLSMPGKATAQKALYLGSGANQPATPEAPTAEVPKALPVLIQGEIVKTTDKTIEVKPKNGGNNLVLNLGDNPIIVDFTSGQPVELKNRENDNIAAYYGPAVAMSMPPQSNALVVMLNAVDGGVPPQYAVAEAVEINESQAKVTINNGSVIVTIKKDVPILTYLTKNIVTLGDIKEGSKLLMWIPVAALSYPAQANAEKVLFLGSPETTGNGQMVIKLQIDNKDATVNGYKVALDAPPIISNERTMLPIRFIAENLGCNVGWDDKTRTVTVSDGDINISLQIGSNQATVNGESVYLDAPPIITNNRTMLPIRFIAEELGCVVDWDDTFRTATITK
ncbi:MAG: copper amine oxidase N-terminal domain-containing protein [Clostridiales bacterium]|jgi:hypothetical protein|nr:copper amine oxidase N-terminal domain-containing protein [Clostridiales bacterium]